MNSIHPCWEMLTFGPWIYLVPQYRPDSVLMLGYAQGTAAGLIRLFYGNEVWIVGVDNGPVQQGYDALLIDMDAREYIKTCSFFDVVIVDLFASGKPCEFVFGSDFAENVAAKCAYLIVHAQDDSDLSAYARFHKVKTLWLNHHRFYYYAIGPCPKLPVR